MVDMRLGLIYGSSREGRFCDTVANWAAGEIADYGGFSLKAIDPKALGSPLWSGSGDSSGLQTLRRRLAWADAFVVVTPEFNHGYPAVLKDVIDAAYGEWQAKPVAFVCYGGISGGLRAVEQLRQVFAELHAVTLRDTVSFAQAWDKFNADGELIDPGPARAAMTAMLTRLVWWTRVLKEGRATVPYGDVAVG